MNELLKKGFFLGLGAAVTGKEKVQTYLDDLVSKGQITPKEADEWMDEMVTKGKSTEAEWSSQAKDRMQDSFKDMGVATQKDINELKEQLAAIELQLAQHIKNNDDENNSN
ncbi:phasin family protein [Thalassorhabdus alkalitolerans]|uniref:Phasin family protein n=2 Tax=Bacillaceae TaxID=186817 RepID=A0ABW0YW59_9BACI